MSNNYEDRVTEGQVPLSPQSPPLKYEQNFILGLSRLWAQISHI